MKIEVIIVFIILSISSTIYAQSTLLKNSKFEPEGIFGNEIAKNLRDQFNSRKVPNCYSSIFYVKFELSENSKIQNVEVSANFTDSIIIGIVRNAITNKDIEWDIEKCKKK